MASRTAFAAPRLLLIGEDPVWREAVGAASVQLGATLETVAAMSGAIGRLLQTDARFSHVLLSGTHSMPELDALNGLIGEAAQPAKLLLLGGPACWTDRVLHVAEPRSDGVVRALRDKPSPSAALPPLLAADVSAAMHGGGLRMRFQPIVASADLSPIAVEALARVTHASRGTLHPRDFLPLAVSCEQERMLTRIAASRVCVELRDGVLGDALSLTLNLPVSALLHMPSVKAGLELCATAGIAPERVLLEVLETKAMPDLAVMGRAMEAWRRPGFRLAMDDAGPSLPHWRQLIDLPFDTVKLDGAMVARADKDALTARIVAAAKQRGHEVIAEGIETEARLARMRALGVDAVQGFLFARPLPALALPVWLRQWRAGAMLAA
jgi:EAL domain-containing protein (putative c-di-GMP-specific phosphodiesterase class I)